METIRVYCGTYHKYNNGSLKGEWVDLSDYDDLEELYEYFSELHDDEDDPEYMFQDYEIPEDLSGFELISESYISDNVYEILEAYEDLGYLDDSHLLDLHREYCGDTNRGENNIYYFQDSFFDEFFSNRPMDAARAASFGNITWSHTFIRFDGYSNLETTDYLEDWIDRGELIQWKIESII